MKIAIASVQVPFIRGGAEFLTDNLNKELTKRGFESDIITIPFKWYPASALVDSLLTARLLDLSEVNGKAIDRVIGMKFPMYCVKHSNKVIWAMHQHRQAYELWGTEFSDLEHMDNGYQVRDIIINADNKFIRESKAVYTISNTVSNRMRTYNDINSETLYHPPADYEKLFCGEFGDYVFYPSRLTDIKRQHLIVEAMRFTKSDAKLVLAGTGDENYIQQLNLLIEKHNIKSKIRLLGNITQDDKIRYYSEAFMVYNGPYGEDYGYVTLEGFYSGKPVLTHVDSGGPLEFVKDGVTGYVTDPDPEEIASKIDYLYENKKIAMSLGRNGTDLMESLKINWDYVIERLTQ